MILREQSDAHLMRHSVVAAEIIFAAGLLAAVLIVYQPALRGGFVWDDDTYIRNSPLMRAPDGLARFWFSTDSPDYFPVAYSLLWIERRLFGDDTLGYHLVNVALHVASALLLARVLAAMGVPGARLAALVFAVHPVNVESVAWIYQQRTTLPMALALGAMLAFFRFESIARRRDLAVSLALFGMALLSKTSVVTLPLILLGCAAGRRGRITTRDVRCVAPFFLLALAAGLVTIWFQYERSIREDVVRTDDLLSRTAIAGRAVWFYLHKALVPRDLMFVYPRWPLPAHAPVAFVPLAALIATFVVLWRYRHGWGRPLLAGLACYVVALLPMLGFLNIYFMRYSLVADHWQYAALPAPIAVVCGLAAHLAGPAAGTAAATGRRAGSRFLSVAVGAAALVIAALAWQARGYAGAFRDEETIWRDTLAKNPSAWIAHNNLAVRLMNAGRTAEARRHLDEALRLFPEYPEAHQNLGNLLAGRNDLSAAIEHFSAAVRHRPNCAEAHNNLGNALAVVGAKDRAITHFEQALRLRPDYAAARFNLGLTLVELGRDAEAAEQFAEVVRLDPADADARRHLEAAFDRLAKLRPPRPPN